MRRTRERFRGLRLEVRSVEVFVPPMSPTFVAWTIESTWGGEVADAFQGVVGLSRWCCLELKWWRDSHDFG